MTTKEQLSNRADRVVDDIRNAQIHFERDIKDWVNFKNKNPYTFKKEIKEYARRLIKIANTIK